MMNLRKLLFAPLVSLLFMPLYGAIDEKPVVADSVMSLSLIHICRLTRLLQTTMQDMLRYLATEASTGGNKPLMMLR